LEGALSSIVATSVTERIVRSRRGSNASLLQDADCPRLSQMPSSLPNSKLVPSLLPSWSMSSSYISPLGLLSPAASARMSTPTSERQDSRVRVAALPLLEGVGTTDCLDSLLQSSPLSLQQSSLLSPRPSSSASSVKRELVLAGRSCIDAASTVASALESVAASCNGGADIDSSVGLEEDPNGSLAVDSTSVSVSASSRAPTVDAYTPRTPTRKIEVQLSAPPRTCSKASSTPAASSSQQSATVGSMPATQEKSKSHALQHSLRRPETQAMPMAWLPAAGLAAPDGPRRQTSMLSTSATSRANQLPQMRRGSAVQGAGSLLLRGAAQPVVAPSPWPQLAPGASSASRSGAGVARGS